MKKILKTFIFLFVVFSFTEVNALSPSEIRTRQTSCPAFELANAKEDGSLDTVGCYDSYEATKQAMDATPGDGLCIVQGGMIIDAKYALIDYDQTTSLKYINVYDSVLLNKRITYIAPAGTYSDDAAYLGVDPNTLRIKIKVSGVTGYIGKYENEVTKTNILYDIIPISWVKTPTYYQITNDSIIHHFPANMSGTNGEAAITIGRKPDMVNPGNYYSYDGNYFYTDMKLLLDDYRNGVTSHAVNANNPYYNYYQYLSFRTKTNYSAANLNAFIGSRTSSGIMLNTGDSFIDAQNKYGVNAALMFSIGINESAFGNSPIALAKNNLFGLNATDKNPSENASVFASAADCIYNYAYGWLSYRFLQPGDAMDRFHGAMVGNKLSGLNIKYASDPYWGEKAAAYYYQLDRYFGFQDYNSYTIALLNNQYQNTVYAKKTPGGLNVSTQFYQYRDKDSAVVVIGETTGPAVNGNTTWYQIMSDPDLRASDLEYTDASSKTFPRPEYAWDKMKVYVPAAYFTKINKANTDIPVVDPTPDNPVKPDPTPTPSPSPTPVPTPPPAKAISTIVSESGYRVENGYFFGVQPGTNVSSLSAKIVANGGSVTSSSSTIGTGVVLTITSGELKQTFTVVIYGDVDGDGSISAVDYVQVKNHIMGNGSLNGAKAIAADVNKDGSVSAVDYVNIKNYIMGNGNVIHN